jgi:hypothetical protein
VSCRYAWLEPSSCITHDLNRLNMETGQQEDAYPDGMWQFVLQVGGGRGRHKGLLASIVET